LTGQVLLKLDKQEMEEIGIKSVGHRARLAICVDHIKKQNGQVGSHHRIKKIAIEGTPSSWLPTHCVSVPH